MNLKTLSLLALLTTIAGVGVGLIPTTVSAPSSSQSLIASTTAPYVPVLNPALVGICTCESGQGSGKPQQYNADGSVRRGKINPHDIGECQINSDYHEAAASKMGMDIYTQAGNIAYANWLYAHEGTTPWNWSKGCWLPTPLSTSSPQSVN